MEVKFKVGYPGDSRNYKLWFNFIPYLYIASFYGRVLVIQASESGERLVIQAGWLFWDAAVRFTW